MTPSLARARAQSADPSATATQILDVAERLAQTRGFNGFSYANIAAELGMTKASLHYHFATKADLGRTLIERYSSAFAEALSRIAESDLDAYAQLERYVALYAGVLTSGRICLCGMLAAEYATLPEGMQQAIRNFFDKNEEWLARVLDQGRRAKRLAFSGDPSNSARVLTAALEGAMLLARPYDDAARFSATASHVLREFLPAPTRDPVRVVKRSPPRTPRSAGKRR